MTILWDLTLDGNSIGDLVDKMVIVYGESSVHNTIEISSIDKSLFLAANPDTNKGTHRITLHIGDRELYFLLEERKGGEIKFTLWGRSLSARDESAYRVNVDYSLSVSTLASTVVSQLITTSTINWNIMDWMLPDDFSFSGNAMDGAQQIVKAVGGIMRCKDNGDIDVRYKWNVRPKDIASTTSVADYSRVDTLIALTPKDVLGNEENTVTITGHTPDLDSPVIETEESNLVVEQDANVRVFWGKATPPAVIDQYVTDGYIQDLGNFSDEYEDEVVFIEGVASLPRPIHIHNSTTWMGDSAAPVTFTAGEMELFSDELWGIATINYRSNYHKYRLYGHNEAKVLMALTLAGDSDISVTVKLDVGVENIAAPISDNLLTTADSARQRGQAYLDDNYYNFKIAGIQAPYNEEVGDGDVILVSDSDAGVTGRYYIKSVQLLFNGPAVLNQLEIIQPK